MIIPSILGEIRLEGNLAGWQLTHTGTILEPDLEEIRIQMESDQELPPPQMSFLWSVPQIDMQTRWTSGSIFRRNLPPDWSGKESSQLASNIPMQTFLNLKGQNRLTLAVSEAKRFVQFSGGVNEESNRIKGEFKLGVFLSGTVGNAAIAVFLTWLGNKLGLPLYLAAVVVFGTRMFQNFAEIRRELLTSRQKSAKIDQDIVSSDEEHTT